MHLPERGAGAPEDGERASGYLAMPAGDVTRLANRLGLRRDPGVARMPDEWRLPGSVVRLKLDDGAVRFHARDRAELCHRIEQILG